MMICAMAVTGCGKEEVSTTTEVHTVENTSEQSQTSETTISSGEGLDISDMFSNRDKDASYDESTSKKIELSGSSAKCDADQVEIDENTITIKDEGTYILSGELNNGSVIVDAEKSDKIQLVFNQVEMVNEDSAPVYVKQADKVFITLAPDTTNSLSTTKEFAESEENIDAVIFSKDDLTINGSGTLEVKSVYGHAIVAKDDLVITGGTYQIDAASRGLSGNDSVRIADGEFTITSGKDSIHAENTKDTSLGFVYVAGGSFSITSEADAISASSIAQLDYGTFDLNAGGGSQNAVNKQKDEFGGQWGKGGMKGREFTSETTTENTTASSDTAATEDTNASSDTEQTESTTSTKGIKAGTDLIINAGTLTIDSADDAIHANNNAYVNGGTFTISTGDDGIHAGNQTVINNGEITISKSYEGIEGQSIEITGGTIAITASDDGLNAAGGNDQSGAVNDIFAVDENAYINISGGTLNINASGDGVDSNGALNVSGGETYVSGPTNDGNGSLDYAGEAKITGGIFVATGTSGMAQNFGSNSTQGAMLVSTDSSQAEGSTIELKDSEGNVLLTYTPQKQYNCVVVSCPEVEKGKTYTVVMGESSTEVEMTDIIYGEGNDMMQGGGMKQGGGNRGQMDGERTMPNGTPGEMPQNGEGGTMPEGMTPPDGEGGTPPAGMPNGENGAAPNENSTENTF